ncbi:MAG: hypothetical protein ABSA13_19440 [Beijerinckiaceae bacterium]
MSIARPLSQARVDGRTKSARQFRDLCADLSGRLGTAPQDALTRTAIHRAAGLILSAETLTSRLAAGAAVDPGALVLVTDAANRSLGILGLAAALEKSK